MLVAELGKLFAREAWCPLCDIFQYQVQVTKLPSRSIYDSYELRAFSLLRLAHAADSYDTESYESPESLSNEMAHLDSCLLLVIDTDDIYNTVWKSPMPTYISSKLWISVMSETEPSRYIRPSKIEPLVDYEFILQGLQDCRHNHDYRCQIGKYQLPGLRVIDCVARSVQQAPPDCEYACLSYAWGSGGGVFGPP